MLKQFDRDEALAMPDESGKVTVTCEFCMSTFVFEEHDLDALWS